MIQWLEENYKELVTKMKESNHAFDEQNPNIYHLEGSVWTHTKMVYKEALKRTKKEEVLLAALLHDIGKPMVREEVPETKRVRFFSHERVSTVLAIDILLKYKNTKSKRLNIIKTLELINWHSDFHNIEINKITRKQKEMLLKKYKDRNTFENMCILSMSDNYGRKTSLTSKEEIENRFKYIKKTYEELKKEEKKEITKKNNSIKVLIGFPNAGKSTYIKENKEKNEEVLSTDNMLLEKYPEMTYNQAYRKIISEDLFDEIEKIFFKNILIKIKENKKIIIDRTNLTPKSRRRILNSLKKDISKEAIIFIVPFQELLKRNLKREKEGKFIPEYKMFEMMKNFTMPNYEEFDKIEYQIFDIYKTKQKEKKEKLTYKR